MRSATALVLFLLSVVRPTIGAEVKIRRSHGSVKVTYGDLSFVAKNQIPTSILYLILSEVEPRFKDHGVATFDSEDDNGQKFARQLAEYHFCQTYISVEKDVLQGGQCILVHGKLAGSDVGVPEALKQLLSDNVLKNRVKIDRFKKYDDSLKKAAKQNQKLQRAVDYLQVYGLKLIREQYSLNQQMFKMLDPYIKADQAGLVQHYIKANPDQDEGVRASMSFKLLETLERTADLVRRVADGDDVPWKDRDLGLIKYVSEREGWGDDLQDDMRTKRPKSS